jgi:hypothetical protein
MTEKTTMDGTGLDALERVLERFGSDRTRWPAPVRRDLAGLLAGNAEAKTRLSEAEALDRLLDLAPQPEIDTRALADRIVAAAIAETPAAAPVPKARVAWASLGRRTSEGQWPAAALLAASLVLGTVFGLTGTLDQAVAPLVADASYEAETEIDSDQIAFDADAFSMFEEDLL